MSLSCKKQETITATSDKLITVPILCIGEISDIVTTPLRSSTSNDLCAIQVHNTTNGANSAYARGVFDNLNDVRITLVEGNTYRFKVLYLKNAKNKIDNIDGRYFNPFNTNEASTSSVTNEFEYSNSVSFSNLSYETGSFDMYGSRYKRYDDEMYYGKIDNVSPSTNTPISISMKKAFFGLKVIADWKESIKRGSLEISVNNAPTFNLPYNLNKKTIETYLTIYAYYHVLDSAPYTDNANVSINYIDTDGTVTPVASQSIGFVRNTMTTITVSVGNDGKSGIAFNFEDNPMADSGKIEF